MARSRVIVDAILEGAGRLLGQSDPLNTNRVAEIAGVSVGSLYQYFPGKDAIVGALVRKRMRDTYDALLEQIEASHGLPLEVAVRRIVDVTIDLKVAHHRLDKGVIAEAVRVGLTEDTFALDAEYVKRFADAFEAYKPAVRDDLPSELGAYLVYQSIRAVMIFGSLQRPDLLDQPRLREELERLLLGYLAPSRVVVGPDRHCSTMSMDCGASTPP